MRDAAPHDPTAAHNTTFEACDAHAYEQAMGRWSRRLAPPLIRFGGVADGDRLLDIGCGTGSLAFTLPDLAKVAAVTGIDQSEIYIKYARERTTDPRFHFQQADARDLPFDDASFDRTYSMLVLQFIPNAIRAVAEMRRVVRSGGTVTAAVWDSYGGMPQVRMIWDIAAVLDTALERPLLRAFVSPGELAEAWRAVGLVDVNQINLLIRVDYDCFDDYWLPMTAEGPVASYIKTLSGSAFANLERHVRHAYCANRSDGPRSFANVAWACRGTVPR